MSEKPFEVFLTDELLCSESFPLLPGYRYQFQSPDSSNSKRLYDALIERCSTEVMVKGTELPAVEVARVKLVPVLHSETGEGFSENFISHLRDEVSGQAGDLKNSALLIIHNSMLDTLINSAEDVAHNGSAWHPEVIKSSLQRLIDKSTANKEVSECLLKHRFAQIVDEGATIFGYEHLYTGVRDGDLKFDELGLLKDSEILKWKDQPKQIDERLEQNRKLHEKLSIITERFSSELVERLADIEFSEKFVKKHFGGSDPEQWKTELDFVECRKEQQKNRKNLLEWQSECLNQGRLITKQRSTTSKAGKRDRHLIILLDEEQSTFELEITFTGGQLESKELVLSNNKSASIDVLPPNNSGGKKSKVKLIGSTKSYPSYFTLALNRDKPDERYSFKCLVIKSGDFYVEAFQHTCLIEPKKQRITLQTEDNHLQISDLDAHTEIGDIGQIVDASETGVVNFEKLANESDEVQFCVQGKASTLTFNIVGAADLEPLSLPLMLDQGRYVQLYKDEFFGRLSRNNSKVLLDNKEVSPKARRLVLVQREASIVSSRVLYVSELTGKTVKLDNIEHAFPCLYRAYADLFDYCESHKTTPSLSGWGKLFRSLVSKIVDEYNTAISLIDSDRYMTEAEKALIDIGYATYQENDALREYVTPLHPLILAYHLTLADEISQDESESYKSLPKVTVERLNARGLLPFIYSDNSGYSFSKVVTENSMWLELLPKQETSYSFVRKLIKDKVKEFRDAFDALFVTGSQSTLIINSVNNAQNAELFLGLVDYVKEKKDKVSQIHVNLYDDKLAYCEFDRFAETASYDELKSRYGLDKGNIREQADSIIDLLRTRLTYSKFTNKECGDALAYAHLSFFKNNNEVEARDVNVLEELSGVACHGLMPGEASDSSEGNYITAFGLKGVDISNNRVLSMAQKLNGLIKPTRMPSEKTSASKSMALAVSDRFKADLERCYDSSIWTTIIDPKVTLDFFDSAKDVVLIHYSDNYTNSTNYDAITVTKQTELYRKVLEQDEGGIIEEFNAFNGEWLLKMITANDNERKEKKSIICAYKYISCLLSKSDITWVPLSVAEMVRVSGNIGLKMSDSEFSRNVQGYRSGLISDDVLFVGFKDKKVYLLPLEVKAGIKQKHKKGVAQAKELKRYLTEDILGNDSLAGHLYRGLFIRQVLMQVDKYRLYSLYVDNYFDDFTDEREWWLQGDYQLAEIDNYPEGFLVAVVENDTFFDSEFEEVDNILTIQIPHSNRGYIIETPLTELMKDARPSTLFNVPEEYFLTKTAEQPTKDIHFDAVGETPKQNSKESEATEENDTATEDSDVAIDADTSYGGQHQGTVGWSPENSLKVLIGHAVRGGDEVYWEPTNTAKFMNTNSGIIGTMGTGKTQCTKSVVAQLQRGGAQNVDGKPIGILIFDYKSDYVDEEFINATGGKKHKLFKLPYNPLSLFGDTPMLPIHTATGFAETMSKAYGLGRKQQLKLENLILEAYALAGITPDEPSTWTRTAPTIDQIWDLFLDQEKVEEDSLYAALSKLARFKIFESQPENLSSLYDLVDGVTVIELAGYPPEIQNLVVALTLDLFYSQMQKQGKPKVRGDHRQVTKLILVDEADNFMSQDFASLRKILKEGREYGVGMILSTQDITHFKTSENDYSSYILSWIVHRVSQIKNQDIKSIFNKDDKSDQENLMSAIRGLDKHYSLYVNGEKMISKIRDKAFWELVE